GMFLKFSYFQIGTFWSTGNQELKRKTKEKAYWLNHLFKIIYSSHHPITNITNILLMEGRKGVSQRSRQSQGRSFIERELSVRIVAFDDLGSSSTVQSVRVRYKICYTPKICLYIPFGLAALL
ncbi:hypothetical protein Avbf_16251, partial [Armadillidium vulgare]